MPGNVRQRMIDGALDLLARRGLQSTSFAEVTAATHTPRGSIYHHFPGGKQEMVLEALNANITLFDEQVRELPTSDPATFTKALTDAVRDYLDTNGYEAGCAAVAVTAAAENDEQLDACGRVFTSFIESVTRGLIDSGVPQQPAQDFAALCMATVGGAMTMSRAHRNFTVYDTASRQLLDQARALPTN